MPLQVYADPAVLNGRKVLAGLALLGTDFELHRLDFRVGEHRREPYLSINPNGTVPAAVDGALTLFESNAILMYAADLPTVGSVATEETAARAACYPHEPHLRADANCWLLWEQSSWFPPAYIFLREHVLKTLRSGSGELDAAALADATARWHKKAAVLEARLAMTGAWVLPDPHPSIVDIVLGAAIPAPDLMRVPWEDYPHIRRWWADLAQLPCWVETQKVVDKFLQPLRERT